MLSEVADDLETILHAPSAQAASRTFFGMAERYGASYLQTRTYRRPEGALTSERHFSAGGVVLRIAPDCWPDSEAFRYVCFECNPLLDAIRQNRTLYRFEDFAPRRERRFGRYWDALSEARIASTLCSTSYGSSGKIASLHLGFATRDKDPSQTRALQMAGLLLTERLIELAEVDPPPPVQLTRRELDSLRLVAEGKTDWDVARILGISESTARFHIDNARRKLDAVSRAQAVAKIAHLGLL